MASAYPCPTTHPRAANSRPAAALSNRARARSNHKPAVTKPVAPRDTCSTPPAATYKCPPAKQPQETRQPLRPTVVLNKSARENLSAQRPASATSSASAPAPHLRVLFDQARRAIFPRARQQQAAPAPEPPFPLPSRSPRSAPPRSAPTDQRNHIPTPNHLTARFASRVPSRAPDHPPSVPP